MRRHALAVFALAAGTASAAAGACNIDAAGLQERQAALAPERGALTVEARRSFRVLRHAAEALERNGHEAACDEIVDAAAGLLETEAVWTVAPPPASTDPDAGVSQLNLTSLAAADRPVESAGLIGRTVESTAGATLGEVDGVLLDQGRAASHLIVTEGGFWGSGSRDIAVPTARMLIDPDTGRLYVDIGSAGLDEAPAYGHAADGWDAAANDAWYEARAAEAATARDALAHERRAAERAAADAAMAATADPDEPEDRIAATPRPGGPKRIRVEKDRPEQAQGSND